MVKVKKKPGQSDDQLIREFKKKTLDIVKKAREDRYHKTEQEERKDKRSRRKHLDELKRRRNEQS